MTGNNIHIINSYYELIKSLSYENKVALIEKLTESLKESSKPDTDSWKSLFGALQLDESTEEFIDNLKKERHFVKKSLDF